MSLFPNPSISEVFYSSRGRVVILHECAISAISQQQRLRHVPMLSELAASAILRGYSIVTLSKTGYSCSMTLGVLVIAQFWPFRKAVLLIFRSSRSPAEIMKLSFFKPREREE